MQTTASLVHKRLLTNSLDGNVYRAAAAAAPGPVLENAAQPIAINHTDDSDTKYRLQSLKRQRKI